MRKVLLLVAAFMLVPAAIAVGQPEGFLKVTGGGQVVSGNGNGGGPGDTIAFNAQQTEAQDSMMDSALAKGQLQVINRVAGTGPAQVRFHGEVTCIRTFTFDNNTPDDTSDDQTYIRFGGYQKFRGQRTTTPFTVDTQDNGEGNADDDMIFFRTRGEGDDPCDDSDPATQLRNSTLARGNVQAH